MNRQMHASKNIFLVEAMILCSSSSRMKNKHETFTFMIYYFAHNLFFLIIHYSLFEISISPLCGFISHKWQ